MDDLVFDAGLLFLLFVACTGVFHVLFAVVRRKRQR